MHKAKLGYSRVVPLDDARFVHYNRGMTTYQTALTTTDEVIDALGGNAKVAEIVSGTPNAVRNWRTRLRGKFPAETYVALSQALKHKRLSAPSDLWGQIPPLGGKS